jgi:hypothetical protein
MEKVSEHQTNKSSGGDGLMATINELLCPVCGKVLTSDEYRHAIEEITIKLGEEYQERIKKAYGLFDYKPLI